MFESIHIRKICLFLVSAAISLTCVGYSLNVVNLYPGPLNAIYPNPAPESNSLLVWGIPKNAKPILLAKIPLGSEAALSWPGNLEKIHLFSAAFAHILESRFDSNKTAGELSQPFEKIPGITTLTSSKIPPSGSRIFVMPSVRTYSETPIKIISTIPEIKTSFAAMQNPYANWTPTNVVAWLNNLINYLNFVKSKLKLLSITDSTIATTIDQVITNYNNIKPKL